MKLYLQKYQSGVAVGMQGRAEEIERQSNFYYNYKITNMAHNWLGPDFAYILTTEYLLLKGLALSALLTLQETRIPKNQLARLSEAKAHRQFDENFIREIFLPCG